MTQSEKITELLAALTEAQNEFPTMPKSSQAYGYKYADLDTIANAIKPILHKYGLGYMQSIGIMETGGVTSFAATLTTRIFHKSGQYVENTAILPEIAGAKNNAAQVLGMGVTYMRRYALCAMLGITSDEDTDANQNASQTNRKPETAGLKAAENPQGQAAANQANRQKMKGGESTAEEKARIKELCGAKYENGGAIFSAEEIRLYSGYRAEKTAAELIAFIENALRNRRQDAPELRAKTPTAEEMENWRNEKRAESDAGIF